MTEWWRLSAREIVRAIRDGETSAEEVMTSQLARVDAVNGKLNAITVRLDEEALAAARAADDRQRDGRPLGPLHGVPVTIKENVDQRGCATTNGVEAFRDLIAAEDAPVVANLRQAGAIPFGRTNTPEFSLRYFTDNTLRGLTLNPWDRSITCGGSSGGAAAGVATGMGVIGHGNDLGGSVRFPAYCNGIVGLRPTLGRVPSLNPTQAEERPPTIQLMSVQGPHCRTVADTRLALAAMSAGDARDPWWVPAPLEGAAPHRPPRAAICADPGGLGVASSVAGAVRRAGDALADAGWRVSEVDAPDVMGTAMLWSSLLTTELAQLMDPAIREHGSRKINRVLDLYRESQRAVHGRTGAEESLEGYLRHLAARAGRVRDWMLFLGEHGVFVGPVCTEPPFAVGEDEVSVERTAEIWRSNRLTCAVNLTGLPSVAVPTGAVDGIPSGVQIVAQRYREDMALDAAQAVEDARGIAAPIDPRW